LAEERADPSANVFDHAVRHISELRAAGRRVLVAGWSEGSLDRLTQILEEHGLGGLKQVSNLQDAGRLDKAGAGLAVLPLEAGFDAQEFVVVAEQDILGDRLVRRSKRRRKASDFISEVAAMAAGDIVVHADHGIGRFVGLRTIEAAGAPHDCLEIHYAGDDRLFLPVENIELLSRYGSDGAEVVLDRLGGVAAGDGRPADQARGRAADALRARAHARGWRLWRVRRALPL
jgi:transcription-repair coupling factor (superfamily II helicase)